MLARSAHKCVGVSRLAFTPIDRRMYRINLRNVDRPTGRSTKRIPNQVAILFI